MHLETLRLYCDVVRLRSFSRGAQLNHVSQSAASQAVQQLETDLGAALIDRTKRPFVLRPEGRAFYDASRVLLDGYEKAKAQIAAVKAELAGTVRVAAIYSVGLSGMSKLQADFAARYPRARLELRRSRADRPCLLQAPRTERHRAPPRAGQRHRRGTADIR